MVPDGRGRWRPAGARVRTMRRLADEERRRNYNRAPLPALKVNFLVLSPGYLSLSKEKTEEGIDARFALYYYARWKFTHDLLPLLHNAKEAGEDVKVMSVLSAGKGGQIDLDDLGLKKNDSVGKVAKAMPTYNHLMIEVIPHFQHFSSGRR